MFARIARTRANGPKISTRNLSKITDQIYVHPDHKISFGTKESSLMIGQFRNSTYTRDNFIENPQFIQKLQNVITENIYDDFSFIMEASMNANSFMPIYDFRDVPRYQRVPDIGNVFGYLQVNEQGQMVKQTYDPNNMYVVYSGQLGLVTLSDHLLELARKL